MHRLLVAGVLWLAALGWSGTAGAWSWPADGAMLQPFTLGSDPYASGQHRGIDVAGIEGSPVRAPASGVVTFAGSVPASGRGVTIRTADGFSVTLFHLGTIGVGKGDAVVEGAPVGTMGWSGEPEHAVPTVHLGVRIAAQEEGYVDPLGLLPVRAAPAPPAPPPAPAQAPAPAPAAPLATSPPSTPATPAPPAASSPATAPPAAAVATPTAAVAASGPTPSPGQSSSGSRADSPQARSSAPPRTDAASDDVGEAQFVIAGSRADTRVGVPRRPTDDGPASHARRAVRSRPAEGRPAATPDVGTIGGDLVSPAAVPSVTRVDDARPRGPTPQPPGRTTPERRGSPPAVDNTAPAVQAQLAFRRADSVDATGQLVLGPAASRGLAPLAGVALAIVAIVLLATVVTRRAARRIGSNGAVLRHHADLLRQLDAAHRSRLHDRGGGRVCTPSTAARP